MASVPSKLLLLTLLCSYHSLVVVHAGGEGDARSHRTVLDIESMKPKPVCSEPKAVPSSSNGTMVVPLHHRYGPCSPVAASEKVPTLEEMLKRDQLRASYIQRKFSRATATGGVQQSSDATVPTTLGTTLNTLEYVISVGLGSPAVTQNVLIDTGSDVSWVQCEPCSQCHDQADALFDPSASSTYFPFSCSSRACAQLGQEGSSCSSNNQCQYSVTYGDGSTTTGTYSSDTLKLGSDVVVKSFQFGCSHAESSFDDKTAGLMGLGGGAQSLATQTAGTFGKAFSYCLASTSSSPGFLKLGATGTSSSSSGFVKTPMVISAQIPTFYGVLLQAIRVGGKQINVPSSVFSAGVIMDSGTIITRLPSTAYKALSSAFKAGMKQYPLAAPSSDNLLDTCFDFSGQSTVTTPTVALVFSGGAVVNLDGSGVLLDNCLAFAPNDDDSSFGIIGNVQQRTFEVLYDVGGRSVGFRAGAC